MVFLFFRRNHVILGKVMQIIVVKVVTLTIQAVLIAFFIAIFVMVIIVQFTFITTKFIMVVLRFE